MKWLYDDTDTEDFLERNWTNSICVYGHGPISFYLKHLRARSFELLRILLLTVLRACYWLAYNVYVFWLLNTSVCDCEGFAPPTQISSILMRNNGRQTTAQIRRSCWSCTITVFLTPSFSEYYRIFIHEIIVLYRAYSGSVAGKPDV